MKKVFLFEIKKLIVPLSVYLAIMSILGFTIMLMSTVDWTSFATLYGFCLLFMMVIVIYLVFSYNKKRISADMTYALPVTKKQLFLGKYFACLAAMFSMAILYFLICLIMMGLAKANGCFEFSLRFYTFSSQMRNFALGSLLHLVTIIPLFNFLLLFYYKANTVLDGIVFVGFGALLLLLVTQFFINLTDHSYMFFSIELFISAPERFMATNYNGYYADEYVFFLVIFIIYVVLGYLILLYLWWFTKKDCSIRTQAINDEIFGYKVFLPMAAALLPLVLAVPYRWYIFEPIWFILTGIGLFIGYCIYHRSIKFSKTSYIVFSATLAFDFIFLVLSLAL